jgi:uncharacterized protein (TIGR00255 family)
MTGFGRGSAEAPDMGLNILVEINSVNRKTLDLQINAPREWSGYEARFGQWMEGAFQRGRVSLQVKVESTSGEGDALQLNTTAMKRSIRELQDFAADEGIDFQPDGGFLLDLARSVKDTSGLPDWKTLEALLERAVQAALSDIDSMRLREGAALAEDLKIRIKQLDQLRTQIELSAEGSAAYYRDALLERLKQLDLGLDPSDERVLKEVAFFADRADISEEMTRLASHFEQFLDFLNAGAPTGRKMDFLCQEIHRELNTTGSKSSNIEITRHIIEAKNMLERIREQVQNVE